MSQVLVNETSLTAIADAIREKNGETTTYKPSEMSGAISALTIGTENETNKWIITGDCSYLFDRNETKYQDDMINELFRGGYNSIAQHFQTKSISDAESMFKSVSTMTVLPFELNLYYDDNTALSGSTLSSCFSICNNLLEAPIIKFEQYSSKLWNLSFMFQNCWKLKDVSNLQYYDWSGYHWDSANSWGNYDASMSYMFAQCKNLRSIPTEILQEMYFSNDLGFTTSKRNGMFYYCKSLQELQGFPLTNNEELYETFSGCMSLKELTFTNQCSGVNREITIDLSYYVGYFDYDDTLIDGYYTGEIPQVTDDATYQEYKNDISYWTKNINYSRYNRLSAINTLNSLPQAQNGPCEIIFKGDSGAKTDGGAINTMTPEEIAIATAKDWTVSFV